MKNMPYLMTIGFIMLCTSAVSTMASKDNDLFTSETAAQALKTPFKLPMIFKTETGNLSVTFNNDPHEEDLSYMRAHNLKSPSDFMKLSHNQVLRSMEVLAAQDNPTLEPTVDNNTNVEGTEAANKKLKLCQDNPIYPMAFQKLEYVYYNKFALPHSVLTLEWLFVEATSPQYENELSIFEKKADFYTYAINSFKEKLQKIAEEIDEKNFQHIRRAMYL